MILVLALIAYGSLYPWEFRQVPEGFSPVETLLRSWNPRFYLSQRVDILVNVALYIPAGICGYVALRRTRGPLAAFILPALIGLSLSVCIELLQSYEPTRKPSMTDVISNFAGSAIGAVLGAVFLKMSTRLGSLDPSAYLVLACWLGSILFPFLPVMAEWTLRMKTRAFLASDPVRLMPFASSFASWYLAGFLLGRIGFRQPAVWLALTLGLVPAQIFIMARQPTWAHLLGAGAGFAAFSLAKTRQRWMAACVFLGVLVVRGLAPFRLSPNPIPFGWMPFASLIDANWQNATLVLIEKMFYCSAAIWSVYFAGVRLRLAIVTVVLLLAGIEAVQVGLPGRTPETTDPVLAILIGIAIDAFRRTVNAGNKNS